MKNKLESDSPLVAETCAPSSIYLQWHGDSDDCDEPVPEESLELLGEEHVNEARQGSVRYKLEIPRANA